MYQTVRGNTPVYQTGLGKIHIYLQIDFMIGSDCFKQATNSEENFLTIEMLMTAQNRSGMMMEGGQETVNKPCLVHITPELRSCIPLVD